MSYSYQQKRHPKMWAMYQHVKISKYRSLTIWVSCVAIAGKCDRNLKVYSNSKRCFLEITIHKSFFVWKITMISRTQELKQLLGACQGDFYCMVLSVSSFNWRCRGKYEGLLLRILVTSLTKSISVKKITLYKTEKYEVMPVDIVSFIYSWS